MRGTAVWFQSKRWIIEAIDTSRNAKTLSLRFQCGPRISPNHSKSATSAGKNETKKALELRKIGCSGLDSCVVSHERWAGTSSSLNGSGVVCLVCLNPLTQFVIGSSLPYVVFNSEIAKKRPQFWRREAPAIIARWPDTHKRCEGRC
jgi:hypothetical protein